MTAQRTGLFLSPIARVTAVGAAETGARELIWWAAGAVEEMDAGAEEGAPGPIAAAIRGVAYDDKGDGRVDGWCG